MTSSERPGSTKRGPAALTVGAAVLISFQLLAAGCGVEEQGEALDQTGGALTLNAALATTAVKYVQAAPAFADLVATGYARFLQIDSSGRQEVMIDVTNIGNAPATGVLPNTQIGGLSTGSSLFQYYGGTATTPNTVNPGEKGYVKMTLLPYWLQRCGRYELFLDLTHKMQSGAGVFDNDHTFVKTQCLEWTSPINVDSFPSIVALTPAEQQMLTGKTLQGIVSSFQVGRTSDGNLCSACHFETAARNYKPPIGAGQAARIRANDVVGGRPWTGDNGWALRFIGRPSQPSGPGDIGWKPVYLKNVLAQWMADGSRPGLDLNLADLSAVATATLATSP